MTKEYRLHMHMKQGDDLDGHLRKTNSNPKALRAWANAFKSNAEKLTKLADIINGEDVVIEADTHEILLYPQSETATQALDQAVVYGILQSETSGEE